MTAWDRLRTESSNQAPPRDLRAGLIGDKLCAVDVFAADAAA